MEQRFKRGNLVRVLVGHEIFSCKNGETETIDISKEQIGKTALIEYSYAEKYGGSDVDSYSVMFTDTGSTVAWKHTNELEFIADGGENLFIDLLAKREAIKKTNTDLSEIVKTWNEKKGDVSSETILFIFDKIGHKSSFLKNGEFYALFADWEQIYPLIDLIMIAKIEQEVTGLLNEKCPTEFREKVVSLFHEVNEIKLTSPPPPPQVKPL